MTIHKSGFTRYRIRVDGANGAIGGGTIVMTRAALLGQYRDSGAVAISVGFNFRQPH